MLCERINCEEIRSDIVIKENLGHNEFSKLQLLITVNTRRRSYERPRDQWKQQSERAAGASQLNSGEIGSDRAFLVSCAYAGALVRGEVYSSLENLTKIYVRPLQSATKWPSFPLRESDTLRDNL